MEGLIGFLMENTYRDDNEVQIAVRDLFLGCAPERKPELDAIWQMLAPKFQLTGDIHEGERFILDAGCYRDVRFNHRVVRAFWLAAYIAWEGYRAIAECPLDAID